MQDSAIAPVPASFRVRIAAMIYESLLVLAVLFIASLPFLYVVGDARSGWQHFLFQFYLAGVLFAYFAAFWLRGGQTLAMKTWRIRLVDRNGGPITLRLAFLRFCLMLVMPALALAGYWLTRSGAWPWLVVGCAGLLWALGDRDRQFLHDRVLGTRLVRVPRKA